MFESDDWDLDQDFLNDVDEKSSVPFFPPDNNESKPKRRKLEISNHSSFSSNHNVDWCEKKLVDKTAKCNEDKVSRKNLILGMFNKNVTDKNVCQGTLSNSTNFSQNNLSNPQSNHQQSCENIQLPRKHLVHEILKKKYIENNATKNNVTNLESQKTEMKIKSNNNINMEQQESALLLNNKIKYETLRKNFQENNCSNNDNTQQRSSESSKKQILCNILKQRSMNNVEFKNKCPIKPVQVQSTKKMTLVRRFPGPAGLLPDDIDTNVSPISYLNSLEENESTVETHTDLLEYCSQNTKDLFTEGAWQLMLNDLPDGFLKGYEIATVKQMANANGYNNTKIDFLAGIVEHIDHSYDNPPVVLKDFTGSIQGIVHKDIPLKYSGLLETNVVILLCDVGLLKTSESFFSNKYQILISPSSLLAIYSNKGKIERTQCMESIVGNVLNEETKEEEKEKEKEEIEIDHSLTKTLEKKSLKSDSKFDIDHINNIKEATTSATSTKNSNKKSSSSNTNLNKTFENMNESINFDPKPNASKKLSHNSKMLQMNVHHSLSTNIHLEGVETKISDDRVPEIMDIVENDVNISEKTESVVQAFCNDTAESIQFNNTVKRNKLSVYSRLLQYKNTDALTATQNFEYKSPLDLKKKNEIPQDNKLLKITNLSNSLYTTENDSDDEMLSQLDMDTIFSNYNNES